MPAMLTTPKPPRAKCSIAQVAPSLAPFAGQVVLADVNDTPELLYRTQLSTVGSLYHRNAAGFVRLRDAWRSQGTSGHVPSAVAATGATLLLMCGTATRSSMADDGPPDTLWDEVSGRRPPPWLHELPLSPDGGFRLYQVR